MAGGAFFNDVPRRFVLPVIVATAERESVFGPNDHRAVFKPARLKRLKHLAREHRCVPHIGHLAREKRPRLAPICAVVVQDFAELLVVEIDASTRTPAWVVFHAIGRVSNHEMRHAPPQQGLDLVSACAIAAHDPMPPQHPHIARPGDGFGLHGRRFVGVGFAFRRGVERGEQLVDFTQLEAGEADVVAFGHQVAHFQCKHTFIPPRI